MIADNLPGQQLLDWTLTSMLLRGDWGGGTLPEMTSPTLPFQGRGVEERGVGKKGWEGPRSRCCSSPGVTH